MATDPKPRLARQVSRTLSIQRDRSPQPPEKMDPKANYWPAECANKGVQESDGSFFESFTALVWKQENRRRRLASENESTSGGPLPLESQYAARSRTPGLKASEYESLYIEVLYTIKHKVGATTGSHLPFIQDLYLYAREAFGFTHEEHARLLAKAADEKPPVLVLNATVVEAEGLEAKDADGFSDPYCMMGIVPGNRAARERLLSDSQGNYSSDDETSKGKKESALKKFSQSFKKKREGKTARDLIPVRFIRTTTVKHNTLNPYWNEKFRCDLENINSDRIHLDIWDHDDEFNVVDAARKLNEVQGFKGLGRYFKQIAQSARTSSKGNVDDFLGAVNVPLDEVPSTGLDRWFDLEGRSARSNVEGRIHLQLQLSTREDKGYDEEEESWREVGQHHNLLRIFVDHEIKHYRGEPAMWDGRLCQAAQTILHQHAIQGDITETQLAMCRWMAFSGKHRDHAFDWRLLLRLLKDLDLKWINGAVSKEEEDSLSQTFVSFIDYCMGLVARQREVFPSHNKHALDRLQDMLYCLDMMYSMAAFRYCCPFEKELTTETTSVIKKSCSDWYDTIRPSTEYMSEDETTAELIALTNRLNSDMQRALHVYSPIYERCMELSYFSAAYKQVEKMLSLDVTRTIQEELGEDLQMDMMKLSETVPGVTAETAALVTAPQMGINLFELYLVLQEFCGLRQQLVAGERKGLAITQFYEWFKTPVQRWITVSKYKLHDRVRKAVSLDKVGAVDGGYIKQSTSAVDVACCFGQIVEFWKSIDWPDHPGAMPFVTKITEDMCQGAMLYADLIHEKLKSAGYYDEIGQFDVTEQLCITINDIEQVRRALRPLADALQFQQIARSIERQHGERTGRQAAAQLGAIVKAADDDMVKQIKLVVDRVADKMRPDIKKDVFHLCWSPEKVPAEDAIGDLMNYLDSNLLTLNTNLFRTNFDRILDSIWVEVLEEIREVLDTEDVKAMWFFERLSASLEILVDFFHANDKGLPLAVINNQTHRELHRQLKLSRADTRELIDTYFIDRLDEQNQVSANEFGTLSVRVYYNVDAEILSVEVLNARNLIPLDPNGLSDPYVLIELDPHHVFPKQTVQQTQVIKKTLNPVFDESFEFCVSSAQCRQRGACILFTVMDHDFLLSNDFAGEAVVSLAAIPGVSGPEVSGFSALKPLSILLTQPKRGAKLRSKDPLKALELRDKDKDAQEFVKRRRDMEALCQT